jgi:hypothetical protein
MSTEHNALKGESMLNRVQGFFVEVTVTDAIPRVRVSFTDNPDSPFIDTTVLSIQGMERMSAVFARAARMAYEELDIYWQIQYEQLRHERAAKDALTSSVSA